MKVYISGAITGIDDYMERFSKAEKYLQQKGYSVVNPAKTNATLPEDTLYEQYMVVSRALLNICEAVFFLNGWQQSNGARKEMKWAIEEDMRIMLESEEK